MSTVITIQGANEKDQQKRVAAFEKLNENLGTTELERIAELCNNPKAVKYFKNPMLFATVKAFLK
jgi:hypothetical protein